MGHAAGGVVPGDELEGPTDQGAHHGNDVFAVGDIEELLNRDMQGAAILCRPKSGRKGRKGAFASSVMLLDCAKLTHWRFEDNFNEMFEPARRDYMDWISLKLEDPATIGLFEPEWNDFDTLTEKTRLLHNTKRKTQPWKTGLKIDYRPADTFQLFPPRHWLRRGRRALFGDYRFAGTYEAHPDPAQERFFFGLVRDALADGAITEDLLREEIRRGHLRADALQLLSAAQGGRNSWQPAGTRGKGSRHCRTTPEPMRRSDVAK